jgi:dienelactone hydrolase
VAANFDSLDEMNSWANLRIIRADCPFPGSYLFTPNEPGPHSGVLLLHGSEGGFHSRYKFLAQLLAAHGFSALAFCYFGASDGLIGPRETLRDIELLRTHEAFLWLKSSKYVCDKKSALHGASRGAEHALLLSSLLAKENKEGIPDCVAVHAPSDIVCPSWNWDWDDPKCWIPDPVRPQEKQWNPICGPDPAKLLPEEQTAWLWKGIPIPPETRIEVERYRGPLFMTHGEQDDVWYSEKSRKIEASLRASGASPECRYFSNEGHLLSLEAENERNNLLINFLHRNLSS